MAEAQWHAFATSISVQTVEVERRTKDLVIPNSRVIFVKFTCTMTDVL